MKPDTMKMRIKAAAAAAVLGLSLFGALPAAASTKVAAVPETVVPAQADDVSGTLTFAQAGAASGTQTATATVAAEPRVLTQATATQKGSLTIEVAANDSYTHTTTPLISAGVTVSKIATLDDKATNKYSLLPAYADLEKTYRTEAKVTKTNIFDQMTASQSNTLASLLAKRAASAGSTRTTDKNGRTEFSPLDEGIFLVQQTQAVKGYKSFEPFLVCVPLKEDGAWNYTVTADPKTAPEKESDHDRNPVRDSDRDPAGNETLEAIQAVKPVEPTGSRHTIERQDRRHQPPDHLRRHADHRRHRHRRNRDGEKKKEKLRQNWKIRRIWVSGEFLIPPAYV